MGKKGKRGRGKKSQPTAVAEADDCYYGEQDNQSAQDVSLASDSEGEEAEFVSDDPAPIFEECLDLIQNKTARTRVSGLLKLQKAMYSMECNDCVDSYRDELFMYLSNCAKRGKEKESVLASTVLSLCVLILGPEEESLFEYISPNLETVALKARKPAIRSEALRALCFSCFISTMEHSHTWHIFDLLYGIIAKSHKELKKDGDDLVLTAACDCFGLLSSTIQQAYFSGDNFEKIISRLGSILNHPSPNVRIAAGQTLAMVFEINNGEKEGSSRKPSGGRHRGFSVHSQRDDEEGEELDEDMVEDLSMVMGVPEVVEAVEILASEYDRSKGKKERKEQRSVFRDIVATVSEGQSPECQMTIRNESLTFQTWASILQLNFIKSVLGPGFQYHFRNNSLIRDIFQLGAPPEEAAEDKMTKLEKRMYMSENSYLKKERSIGRKKDRRDKHNAKHQFLTHD